jgi:hypothetical protein
MAKKYNKPYENMTSEEQLDHLVQQQESAKKESFWSRVATVVTGNVGFATLGAYSLGAIIAPELAAIPFMIAGFSLYNSIKSGKKVDQLQSQINNAKGKVNDKLVKQYYSEDNQSKKEITPKPVNENINQKKLGISPE